MGRRAQPGDSSTGSMASASKDSDSQTSRTPERKNKISGDGGQLRSRTGEPKTRRGDKRVEKAPDRASEVPYSQLAASASSGPAYKPPGQRVPFPAELHPPAPEPPARPAQQSPPAASIPVVPVWTVPQEMDLPFFF
jgi:hypothetical protein